MRRGQIIKRVILNKCIEANILGYINLNMIDKLEILADLRSLGIELTDQERHILGFEEGSHENQRFN